ncbi:unnamed protein product [Durusdinium trenchii]|uniref:Plastid lipid-associated protein/fibrillin conserved domain-containing protein n=2 Tax=Durusdinium trenchii TaxID=1381693 RepID=A0ABP0SJL1_9DINO
MRTGAAWLLVPFCLGFAAVNFSFLSAGPRDPSRRPASLLGLRRGAPHWSFLGTARMGSFFGGSFLLRDGSFGYLSPVKRDLLALADETRRGTTASAAQRRRMSQLADDLSSTASISTKSMLSGTWNLVYTTEKEVLSLIGDPGAAVYQKIDVDGGTLGNSIEFGGGKRFDVQGVIESQAQSGSNQEAPYGLRSDFTFTGAALQLPPVTLPLPPFGAGWFVSTYLDEGLRVNRDSRGDLAIYVRAP